MIMPLYVDSGHEIPVWQKPTPARPRDLSFRREEWVTAATCRQGDPDALFVRGAQQREAAELCQPCDVQRHCLATSLDNKEEFGVWGGLTERQRRALLRKNTHVDNWAEYFAAGGELPEV
ncbi:putative transcriptional regulator [Corynebacterium maris DSM 45190]|uniref:Transcriptional regulator WhiB n=1 Tax=Corynebacterium maris DSM 45190 TaxID=1224163 RepID=S5SRD2_9CORY|nr:WhiB family transcriptional regulator [Corynebacterium maris]AGS33537.1 putative transcriptional regulator [Corynebacterium maris DSM 45190]